MCFIWYDKNMINSSIDIELPTLRHELFFNYLLVSPSYQRVHGLIESNKKIPKNLIPTYETYKVVGNIFDTNFSAWWETGGFKIFSRPSKRKLFVEIDLTKSKELNLEKVQRIIENMFFTSSEKGQISFLNNKVRVSTLDNRFRYLTEKSIDASTAGTKVAGWKLFDYADLSSKNSIRARNRRTTLNTENRTYLTMLSSKHLSEAYSISENAAKGIFPLISKVEKNIPFDFTKIESLFGYGSFTKYQPYTQLQYTNSPVTKHLKKLWQKEQNKLNERHKRYYKERIMAKRFDAKVRKRISDLQRPI
jgi:hypothetical protein